MPQDVKMDMGTFLFNVLVMAGWATLATTVAVISAAYAEQKALAAPINAISHILYGDEAYVGGLVPKFLISGLILNGMAMIGWSVVAEAIYRISHVTKMEILSALVISVVVTVVAYVVDFRVVPERFTPGFEHVLSKRALYGVYVALAIALTLGGIARI